MPHILIWPDMKKIEVSSGSRLLDILQSDNQEILSICGGMGECETCVVQIQEMNSAALINLNKTDEFVQTLACQTEVDRDLLVYIPDWKTLFTQ